MSAIRRKHRHPQSGKCWHHKHTRPRYDSMKHGSDYVNKLVLCPTQGRGGGALKLNARYETPDSWRHRRDGLFFVSNQMHFFLVSDVFICFVVDSYFGQRLTQISPKNCLRNITYTHSWTIIGLHGVSSDSVLRHWFTCDAFCHHTHRVCLEEAFLTFGKWIFLDMLSGGKNTGSRQGGRFGEAIK